MNLNTTISFLAYYQQRKNTYQENGAMSTLDITELFQHLVWTEFVIISLLPSIIIIIIIIMYSRPVLGRYLNLFFNYCLFQVLEKTLESKNCQFGVFLKTFRIYSLVAHCLSSTKRSCKAPHGVSMVIWMIN
jgi:hypothetical protein